MTCSYLVVKIGGALLTDKAGAEVIDQQGLEAAVEIMSNVWHSFNKQEQQPAFGACSPPITRLIITHGAGSFGHHLASKFGLSGSTVCRSPNQTTCLAAVHNSVSKLNTMFVSALVDAGQPCVAVSPLVTGVRFDQSEQELGGSVLIDAVKRLCDLGCIPVVHGDIVPGFATVPKIGPESTLVHGSGFGIRVLSADVIVEHLCSRLQSSCGISVNARSGCGAGASDGVDLCAPNVATCAGGSSGTDWIGGGHLASNFCATCNPNVRAVFLTDVDGVYDKPPEEKGSKLVPVIRVQPASHIRQDTNTTKSSHTTEPESGAMSSRSSGVAIERTERADTVQCVSKSVGMHAQEQTVSQNDDVIVCGLADSDKDCTGGMLLKLRVARLIAESGVEVRIVNGTRVESATQACLAQRSDENEFGNGWIGTAITSAVDGDR